MATAPPMMPPPAPGGAPGGAPGAPPLPPQLLMALMQKLSGQAGGGAPGGAPPGGPPGGPGAALMAARSQAMTPYGKEQNDINSMKAQVGALVPRFLQRDPGIAANLVTIYKTLEKVTEAIAKLPAAPVGGPPPGMPMLGGAAMMPPADASPMG